MALSHADKSRRYITQIGSPKNIRFMTFFFRLYIFLRFFYCISCEYELYVVLLDALDAVNDQINVLYVEICNKIYNVSRIILISIFIE